MIPQFSILDAIDTALYPLDLTLEDLGLSVDELYFYARRYQLDEEALIHFISNYAKTMKKLTKEDYLELLRKKKKPQDAEYSDSKVFFRGKVMGRCPAGTTKSGKTCVPAAPTQGPQKPAPFKGAKESMQAKKLQRARTTNDIIQAHKHND